MRPLPNCLAQVLARSAIAAIADRGTFVRDVAAMNVIAAIKVVALWNVLHERCGKRLIVGVNLFVAIREHVLARLLLKIDFLNAVGGAVAATRRVRALTPPFRRPRHVPLSTTAPAFFAIALALG